MILLTKNETSTVVLTLSENVTIPLPCYFLFEVISDDNSESLFFTAEDVSTNTCRYNEFNITLTDSTTDNTIGLIDLKLNGYYKYKVYQQSIALNLDVELTDGLLESGKLYVKGESKPIIVEYKDNEDNNYITYE